MFEINCGSNPWGQCKKSYHISPVSCTIMQKLNHIQYLCQGNRIFDFLKYYFSNSNTLLLAHVYRDGVTFRAGQTFQDFKKWVDTPKSFLEFGVS